MKLTELQQTELREVAMGRGEFQTSPTVRSLIHRGLIKKDWLHPHSNPGVGIERTQLTPAGVQLANELFG